MITSRLVVVLLLALTPAAMAAPPMTLDNAMKDFRATSWIKVAKAAAWLTAHDRHALPALVELVKSDAIAKLVDTADLIYPGAERFYGHGYAIPYELDHVGDRAAWLLEELTFRDFGFSTNAWQKRDEAAAKAQRATARAAVVVWSTTPEVRTCAGRIVAALKDGTPMAQGLAYARLRRFNAPACEGLDAAFAAERIVPLARAHAAEPKHPLKQQADLYLEEVGSRP